MESGIRLKYTKKPRKFEADSLWLGAHWMFYLPPRQEILSLLTNFLTPGPTIGSKIDFRGRLFLNQLHDFSLLS